jgi:hypothetical protein
MNAPRPVLVATHFSARPMRRSARTRSTVNVPEDAAKAIVAYARAAHVDVIVPGACGAHPSSHRAVRHVTGASVDTAPRARWYASGTVRRRPITANANATVSTA